MDMETQVVSYNPALLIDRNGNFKTEIEGYLNLTADSSAAAAVSIIGIQSTGKSTLLNHLFGTAFQVMDDSQEMAQTTKGIWMTKCPSPTGGSPILVIDTEGSDGYEREVMIRKFNTPRKVNLVFVLRDKNQVPLPKLKEQLEDGLKKIWKEMTKRQALQEAALEKYFQIKVATLPHYRLQREEFVAEVKGLKDRIMRWAKSDKKIAASSFVGHAQEIWGGITKNKDLDLPQYRIMVSGVRCEEIADEKYKSFCKNESWTKIKEQVEERTEIKKQVGEFGKNVSRIWKKYLYEYDADTQHYHQTEWKKYKRRLTDNLLKEIEPVYQSLVNHMCQATLQMFKETDDKKRHA